MRYIRVKWLHDYPDEPIDIYSEIDHEGWEVRKIDVFIDGYGNFADEFISIGSSGLSEIAFIPLEEINTDPEFRAQEISKEAFEQLWKKQYPMSQCQSKGESMKEIWRYYYGKNH